jgi:hypothetical protein
MIVNITYRRLVAEDPSTHFFAQAYNAIQPFDTDDDRGKRALQAVLHENSFTHEQLILAVTHVKEVARKAWKLNEFVESEMGGYFRKSATEASHASQRLLMAMADLRERATT